MRAYIHTNTHTYKLRAYIHTNTHIQAACMHTHKHTYIHTCIHTYTYTYTYIHIYIHACIHIKHTWLVAACQDSPGWRRTATSGFYMGGGDGVV